MAHKIVAEVGDVDGPHGRRPKEGAPGHNRRGLRCTFNAYTMWHLVAHTVVEVLCTSADCIENARKHPPASSTLEAEEAAGGASASAGSSRSGCTSGQNRHQTAPSPAKR